MSYRVEHSNPWFEVRKRDNWHWIVQNEGRGGVVIIAVSPDGRIAFVDIHRQPLGKMMLELPRGAIDAGDPSDAWAAQRELFEEVGVEAGTIRSIERIGEIHPDSGLTASKVSVYLIFISEAPPGDLSEHQKLEGIQGVQWLSLRDALAGAAMNLPIDGISLASLAVYQGWRMRQE